MSARFGEFDLTEPPLGRGASGRVFRARRDGGDRDVALKVLLEELTDDPDARARFQREAQLLAGRAIPGVVPVHEVVKDGPRLALVMDLVEGSTLRDVLDQRGPLPPAEACALMAQVLAGLAATHAAGVLHRDLKPENVMVSQTSDGPRALVTDFGIARLAESSTVTRLSRVLGTPDYLAPEVPVGEQATTASDVYATGVMLYELLAGWRPFRGSHHMAVLDQHRRAPLVRPDDMPEAVWDLLQKMLDKAPGQRPEAAEVATRLAALAVELRGLPAAPRKAPPPPVALVEGALPTESVPGHDSGEQPRRWYQRGRTLGLVAAGAVTLVAVVAGVNGFGPDDSTSTVLAATPTASATPSASPSPTDMATPVTPDPAPPALGDPQPEGQPPPDNQDGQSGSPGAESGAGAMAPDGPTAQGGGSAQGAPAPQPKAPAPQPKAPAPQPPAPAPQPPAPAPKPPAPAPKPPAPAPKPPAPKPPAPQPKPAEKQPYTAEQACGAGFGISESRALRHSVIYLLWNRTTEQNCVVTLKTDNVGVATPMTAFLKPDGGGALVDQGSFKYYAEIKGRTPGCIQWGGSDGADQWRSSPGVHC